MKDTEKSKFSEFVASMKFRTEEEISSCQTFAKSKKNEKLNRRSSKSQTKKKTPRSSKKLSRVESGIIQAEVVEIKTEKTDFDFSFLSDEIIEIESDDDEHKNGDSDGRITRNNEIEINAMDLVADGDQPFPTLSSEREAILNFDLSLISVDNNTDLYLSNNTNYQQVFECSRETAAIEFENNAEVRNLSSETGMNKTCRRCSEPVLDDLQTLECACNVKPVYHKMCVQLSSDVARLSGVQFACHDCSTPIENYNLDLPQILVNISKNVQEKSDFLLSENCKMADRIKQLEEENKKQRAEIARLRQAEERRVKMEKELANSKADIKRKKEEAKNLIKLKYQKL